MCYYSGRGVRWTISTQGGVGGGCNGKMKCNASFFCHAKAKLPRNTGILRFADGNYRQATVATIVPLRRFNRP